jgi:hypothetical protein
MQQAKFSEAGLLRSGTEREDEQYGYRYDRSRGPQREAQYEYLERRSTIPSHYASSQPSYPSAETAATRSHGQGVHRIA